MVKKTGEEIPNCWEFLKCDMEVCTSCPAYPVHGRECWKITGTKCAAGKFIKASFEEKILYCRNECDFYRVHLKALYR